MCEQRFQRRKNRSSIITSEQKNRKCHDERDEIEISWTKRKERVDLICKRVYFRQIFRVVIEMFEQILKKIV